MMCTYTSTLQAAALFPLSSVSRRCRLFPALILPLIFSRLSTPVSIIAAPTFSLSPVFLVVSAHQWEKIAGGDRELCLARLPPSRALICVNWEGMNPELRVCRLTCSAHGESALLFEARLLHNCAEANKRQRWWTNVALGRMRVDIVKGGAYVFECDFHPRLYAGASVGIFM